MLFNKRLFDTIISILTIWSLYSLIVFVAGRYAIKLKFSNPHIFANC